MVFGNNWHSMAFSNRESTGFAALGQSSQCVTTDVLLFSSLKKWGEAIVERIAFSSFENKPVLETGA